MVTISFKNFSRDFNENILYLGFGVRHNSCSNSSSSLNFEVFIGNNLFLKLLRTISPAVKNNAMLPKSDFSLIYFVSLSILFNLLANLLFSSPASFNDKYH